MAMKEFIDRDVVIPADAFVPALPDALQGFISKVTDPSVRYPDGRVEVSVPGIKTKFMWPVAKFNQDWILPTSTFHLNVATPGKKTGKTPRKRSSHTTDASASEGEGLPKSPRPRGRPRKSLDGGAASVPGSPAAQSTPAASPARRGRSRSPAPRAAAGARSVLRASNRLATGNRVQFKDVPIMHDLTEVPRLSTRQNLFNAVLMFAVAIPMVTLGYLVCKASPTGPLAAPVTWPVHWPDLLTLKWWLRLGLHQPLIWVNLVFLLNVDVLFWVISNMQGNTWLIDPYWTILPVLIQCFYQFHPSAQSLELRAIIAPTLLRVWSGRLTWSYFRREECQFGAREDWRFTDMHRKMGKQWWWISFFATYVPQQGMLVGITLPLYAVYTSTEAWAPLDTLASVVAFTGMVIAWVADNQLRDFMVLARDMREAQMEPPLILERGLWKYSRHPNYFGEQMFWWGLALYAVRVGQPWMCVGAAFNSLCMIPVTKMTEARMMRRPERAELYKEYQATTSVWVPWFKFLAPAKVKKEQ